MGLGLGGMSGSAGDKKKVTPTRKLTESHRNQITVLQSMGKTKSIDSMTLTHLQIEEIVEITGLEDEKEIQRILFILEGQKLVVPYPEGDFTSRIWKITRNGMKALKSIEKSFAGN